MSQPRCPRCTGLLIVDAKGLRACIACGHNDRSAGATGMPLAPSQSAQRHNEAIPDQTEEEIQRDIVAWLKDAGIRYITTVRKRQWQTCPVCGRGHHQQGGDGAGKGLGDLLVHIWGPTWLMVDLKTPKGKLSEEQQALFDQGKLRIWRSVADAQKDVKTDPLHERWSEID